MIHGTVYAYVVAECRCEDCTESRDARVKAFCRERSMLMPKDLLLEEAERIVAARRGRAA